MSSISDSEGKNSLFWSPFPGIPLQARLLPTKTATVKVTGEFLFDTSAGDFSPLVDHPFLKHFLPLSSIILTSLPLGYIFKVPLFCLPYKYEIFPHSLVILRPSFSSAHVLLVIFLTPWLKSQILVPASSVRLLTCMHACLLDKDTWLASGHFKPSTFKTGLPRWCSGK